MYLERKRMRAEFKNVEVEKQSKFLLQSLHLQEFTAAFPFLII